MSWKIPTKAVALIGLTDLPEQRGGFYEHLAKEKGHRLDIGGGLSFAPGKSEQTRILEVPWSHSQKPTAAELNLFYSRTLVASAVSPVIVLPAAAEDSLWVSPLAVFAWTAQYLLQHFGLAKTVLLVLPDHAPEEAAAAAKATLVNIAHLLKASSSSEQMLSFRTVCWHPKHPQCRAAAAALVDGLVKAAEPLADTACALDAVPSCPPPLPPVALALRHHCAAQTERLLIDAHSKIAELRELIDYPALSRQLPQSIAALWDDVSGACEKECMLVSPELCTDLLAQFRSRLALDLHLLITELLANSIETFYNRFRSEAEALSSESASDAALRRRATEVLQDFAQSFLQTGVPLPVGSIERYSRVLERLVDKEIALYRARQGLVLQRKMTTFLLAQLDENVLPLLEAMPAGDLTAAWRDIRVAFALVMAAIDQLLDEFTRDSDASDDELALLRAIAQREIKLWFDAQLHCILTALPSHMYTRFEDAFWQLAQGKGASKLYPTFARARAHALQLLDVFDQNAAFELDSTYSNPRVSEARKEEMVEQLDSRITRDFKLATSMCSYASAWPWAVVAVLFAVLIFNMYSPLTLSLPSLMCWGLFALTLLAALQAGILQTLCGDLVAGAQRMLGRAKQKKRKSVT